MRIRKASVAFAAVVVPLALCSAARAQQPATEGVFQGRGMVKAVEPGTGAMTFTQIEFGSFAPASETVYRVRSPEVSECVRPGDTVDFTIDAAQHVIVGLNLHNYDQ